MPGASTQEAGKAAVTACSCAVLSVGEDELQLLAPSASSVS